MSQFQSSYLSYQEPGIFSLEWERQSTGTNTEMIQILRLSDKNFIAAIKEKMLQKITNTFETHFVKKKKKLNKEVEHTKKINGNFRTKKYNN